MFRRLAQLAASTALVLAAVPATLAAAPAPQPHGGGAAPDGPDAVEAATPLTLTSATLTQAGKVLELRVATAERWSPASLRRNRQSLCVRFDFGSGAVASRDLCVRRNGARPAMTLARVLRSGASGPLQQLAATVRKPSPRALVVRFSPARAGIAPGASVRWRALASTDGCDVGGTDACFQAHPQESALLTLRAPQPVGCVPAGPAYVTNGPRQQKVVALTFDDGPSAFTPGVLDVLRRKGVKATFFLIGQQVAPNAALVRQMAVEGHELANHTWSHANVSRGGSLASREISSTTAAIERASGFRPCSFRAPYGATGASLVAIARSQGYTTVQWDVDTVDWRLPGSNAIARRIVQDTRSGSIVLMHDGGGPRAQTVAALPGVIDALRARGYRFVTVAELLGASFSYR